MKLQVPPFGQSVGLRTVTSIVFVDAWSWHQTGVRRDGLAVSSVTDL